MIGQKIKQIILKLISEACKAGARKNKAAKLLGLSIRTIQRWEQKGLSDNRKGSRAVPCNKLTDQEKARIVRVLESPEFADSNPNQIVPKLADQGIYLGSESTMYRIIRALKMNKHRQSSLPAKKHRPEYPEKPFENICEARDWTDRFINWYNNYHFHSSIKFVTPEDRHSGRDIKILANRHYIYQAARLQHPERWSGKTRNWNPDPEVILKKFKKIKRIDSNTKRAA
jgi:transposase